MPAERSRLFLQIAKTSYKAALVATDVNVVTGFASFTIDEDYDRQFMDAVRLRAKTSADPPAAAVIVSRPEVDIREFERELNA